MKRIVIAALLLVFAAAPALAKDDKLSVGASYGLGGVSGSGGVFSFRGDYDISDKANAPVKVRVGWDHYSVDLGVPGSFSCLPTFPFTCSTGPGGNITWSTNVFYGGAYYDFNKMLKLDRKIHPFAGLGFGFGSTSCTGSSYCSGGYSSPTVGGFYYIGGVQYDVTPQIAAELGFSGWTGISIGANFKF